VHYGFAELEKMLVESKRSEDQLRMMIDIIPTLAWSCRPDGTTEFLNMTPQSPGPVRMIPTNEDLIIARPMRALIFPRRSTPTLGGKA
jgi:hypothetical protein